MKKISCIFLTSIFLTLTVLGQVVKSYSTTKEIQKLVDNETNPYEIQNYAVLFSKIGNYKKSILTHQLFIEKNKAAYNDPGKPKADSLNFLNYKPQNAINFIAKAAEKYNVVITNEAHYQPQNRVFTTLLLEKLFKQGFRYLCVEDLFIDDTVYKSKEDKELNTRKYPLRTSGFYIDEPQYGNLVRKALKLGYTLIAYEHTASEVKDPGDRWLARENGQAKNIAEILLKDPKAKVLVHCGYGHLNENIKDSSGSMAAMLKLNFKIDPLTVDQEDLLEEKNDTYYKWTNVKEPSIYVSPKNIFNDPNKNHKVDIVVFFPKVKYINGRPNWLTYDKEKKYFFANLNSENLNYPIMISAFCKGEDISIAVPSDIIEIEKPDEKIGLMLSRGIYTLQIKDFTGIVTLQTIEVK